MPGNDNAPLGAGGVNQKLAGSGMLAPPSLPTAADIADAYCVYLHTPYDRRYRRLFLSLHSAVQAVERAKKRGLKAELILCRLTVVEAVEVNGEVSS
jgi:hypothetical protein